MARLHLVSAEIGGSGPGLFRFEIVRSGGRAAKLEFAVPRFQVEGAAPDVARSYAAARAELVTTLLQALIEANCLDDSLALRRAQSEPNSRTVVDLRRSMPANDDRRMRGSRAGGTS